MHRVEHMFNILNRPSLYKIYTILSIAYGVNMLGYFYSTAESFPRNLFHIKNNPLLVRIKFEITQLPYISSVGQCSTLKLHLFTTHNKIALSIADQ